MHLIIMNRDFKYAASFLLLLLSSIFVFNLLNPSDPQALSRLGFFPQTFPRNSQKSSLGDCDYARGRWVWDEGYPLGSYDDSCPFLDPGFRCRKNGRKDGSYRNWRWQPDGCELPRFNASDLLERSRNGRIVFAGDSVGRNQWESLLCMLTQGVSNLSTIYEVHGNPISKHKGFLAMRFQEYNMTVEYYRAPFLTVISRPPRNSPTHVLRAVRLDQLHWYSRNWIGADVLIFNSGHWWNPYKTTKMGCYFQEGGKLNMTMDVVEAFRRSLHTWKSWALNSLDPERSFVFFRSYSSSHYRNGTWNEGGDCDMETLPEKDPSKLETEPYNNMYISDVIKQMKTGNSTAQFLNITYLSEFRKDGHPSKYREPGTPPDAPQDCSHWCLPGVPDTWNELLYAQLLSKEFRTKKNH